MMIEKRENKCCTKLADGDDKTKQKKKDWSTKFKTNKRVTPKKKIISGREVWA